MVLPAFSSRAARRKAAVRAAPEEMPTGMPSTRATWAGLAPYVDAERHGEVATYLAIQRREAQWWRDASVAYFQSINGLPLPKGEAPPPLSLEAYEAMAFPYAPGI